MASTTLIQKYLRAKRSLEKKLDDINRKLDHIIFRIREADPRIWTEDKTKKNDDWPK